MTRKALRRFINDCKLSIQPICSQEYLDHVFELIPEIKEKYERFVSEIGDDFGKWMEKFEFSKNRMIEDLKNNQKYKDFISESPTDFEKRWERLGMPEGGLKSKSIFMSENNNKKFLSIDLKKANFQALKKVGVYSDNTWEDLVRKYTDSKHLQESKQFRSIIYGNLNIGRITMVEKYITNEFRRLIESSSILSEGYKIVSLMSDEIIYEIDGDIIDNIEEKIKELASGAEIDVRVQQFILKSYYIYVPGDERKIEFFGKQDLKTGKETIHCLGAPYYLIGLSLWMGREDTCKLDHMFINQEGYSCFIDQEFKIKRGI